MSRLTRLDHLYRRYDGPLPEAERLALTAGGSEALAVAQAQARRLLADRLADQARRLAIAARQGPDEARQAARARLSEARARLRNSLETKLS